MKRNTILIGLLLAGMILIAGCANNQTTGMLTASGDDQITLFKSSGCGCCGIYSKYIEKQGLNVNVITTDDVTSIKDQYDIPLNLRSCHTLVMGDYFIEGHVPMEAIEKLITEKPDIAGLAIEGMPSGSPGMPGSKQGPFIIQAVAKDGSTKEFMRI